MLEDNYRPDTKWIPVRLTNIVYEIYNTSYPLGLTKGLPRFITKSKSIISFEKHPETRKLYTDDLCLFRCLAYHKIKKIHCETFNKTEKNNLIDILQHHKEIVRSEIIGYH